MLNVPVARIGSGDANAEGGAPLRFGVGVHTDAATAAADALISAVNRFEWSDDERQVAA